jgi:hypothetical protein
LVLYPAIVGLPAAYYALFPPQAVTTPWRIGLPVVALASLVLAVRTYFRVRLELNTSGIRWVNSFFDRAVDWKEVDQLLFSRGTGTNGSGYEVGVQPYPVMSHPWLNVPPLPRTAAYRAESFLRSHAIPVKVLLED